MKKRTLAAAVLSLAIAISPAAASAESFLSDIEWSVDAGLSLPMGDMAELHSIGFVIGFNGFYPYSDALHFGGRIAYNYLGIDDGGWVGSDVDGSSSMMEFVPMVRYLLPSKETSTMSFFLQGGLGFYRYAFDVEATIMDETFNYDDSDTNLGICLGGGLSLDSGGRTFVFQPLINMVFTEGDSSTYITLTAGITF